MRHSSERMELFTFWTFQVSQFFERLHFNEKFLQNAHHIWKSNLFSGLSLITARKRSLRRLCFYRCLSVHKGGGVCGIIPGGCAWFYLGGHAWFYSGACMVLFGGHAWFYSGGVHGFILGAGVVLFGEGGMHGFIQGGMHGFIPGGHAWFYSGVHGFIWGGMHGFFRFFGYNEIRSMSGRYASYWNAFLLSINFQRNNVIFFLKWVKNAVLDKNKLVRCRDFGFLYMIFQNMIFSFPLG